MEFLKERVMEEEWRVYLKENAHELYDQMLGSIRHQANWRDRKIEQLQAEVERLTKDFARVGVQYHNERMDNQRLRDALEESLDADVIRKKYGVEE